MEIIEVGDCPAVGHHDTLVAPFIAKDAGEQAVAAAAGVALIAVVGTHHLLHVALLHESLEGRKICFAKVARINVLGIEGMAVPFGTGVDGKMFCAGMELVIFGVAWALKSTHHGKTHLRGEVRILAIGFLTAPPTGITENVDVGGPEGQTLVLAYIAVLVVVGLAVFGTGLIGNGIEYLKEEVVVEGGSHGDRLREDRGETRTADAVEGFVPPVVGFDSETGNRRGIIQEQGSLLLEGH